MTTDKIKEAGFTLIELLIVIAVLALLLAIILPALHNSKLVAKQIVCASHIKQWTLAELAYISENNNFLTPYADVREVKTGNALDPKTYWHNRLSPYLTNEDYGTWGMKDVRKCPMGKEEFGENAVWIGVYYGYHHIHHAPFVFLDSWNGSVLTKNTKPFKSIMVKTPANYLMMLDVRRDHIFNFFDWPWDTDYDGDGMNDTRINLPPYNFAQPKIHRNGCNVGLFDGHVKWLSYKVFWEIGTDGYAVHPYWYNQNRP